MTSKATILYLDRASVDSLELSTTRSIASLKRVLEEHVRGETSTRPKTILDIAAGHSFQSLSAASPQLGYAMNKWFGMAPKLGVSTTANIDAIVTLNDYCSGEILAVIDGKSITEARTAAMSALAADYLADPDSRSVGFIGCGAQARSHLYAFKELFPQLSTIYAFSPTGLSAAELCRQAEKMGMTGHVCEHPRDAIIRSEIVVSSVPMSKNFQPFLDPAWVKAGALVSAVDVGRSWHPESIGALDIRVTDDLSQAQIQSLASGPIPAVDFQSDLSQLVADGSPREKNDQRRYLFSFHGLALADLAIASVVYEAAKQAPDTGLCLPR